MPCAPEGSSELPFIYKKKSINYILMFTVRKSKWNDNQMGHLGVPKFLTFKGYEQNLSCETEVLFAREKKNITFISIASHVASL